MAEQPLTEEQGKVSARAFGEDSFNVGPANLLVFVVFIQSFEGCKKLLIGQLLTEHVKDHA